MSEGRFRGLSGPLVAVVVLQVALAWILASLFLSSRHSLANNGHWVSTKTTLAVGVLGANSFFFDLQPLAGGSLDLGAWHGYQEVVTKAEFDPVEIEFDFVLARSARLTFQFNRAGGEFVGVRVSAADAFPGSVLTISPEGEFLTKRPVRKLRRVRPRQVHNVKLELGDDRFVVFLDGMRVGRFAMVLHRPQHLGFRAGRSRAYVDDIRVVSRDGSVFTEDFEWSSARPRLTALVAAGLLPLTAGLFFLFARVSRHGERRVVFFLLMFSGLLVVLGAIVYAFTSYKSSLYPHRSRFLEAQEEYWRSSETERIFAEIEARYPKTPPTGTHRILFVGGSQTRGSGAARDDETLVRRTERLLNQRSGKRVECINAAIHGYTSIDMERTLRERWIEWNPDALVINASNNDLGVDVAVFERNLGAMLALARERDARVVLVMEPNSPERRPVRLRDRHQVMKAVGDSHGATTVDMHSHLLGRYDDGFLWWDWVHLTSYGQRLFAEHLTEEILRLGILEREDRDSGS